MLADYTIGDCSNKEYMQLSKEITDFNLSHLQKDAAKNLKSLGYVLREGGKLVGGVTGKLLLGQNLTIDILWIDDKCRGRGYGSKLLQVIEKNAKQDGSQLAIVDTFDFQALDFYKKQGYTVFGELQDSPYAGHIRYYLSKKI